MREYHELCERATMDNKEMDEIAGELEVLLRQGGEAEFSQQFEAWRTRRSTGGAQTLYAELENDSLKELEVKLAKQEATLQTTAKKGPHPPRAVVKLLLLRAMTRKERARRKASSSSWLQEVSRGGGGTARRSVRSGPHTSRHVAHTLRRRRRSSST